jgi:hypothetical protein
MSLWPCLQLKTSQVICVNDVAEDQSGCRGGGEGGRGKGMEGLGKVAKSLASKRETLLHQLTSFHRLVVWG